MSFMFKLMSRIDSDSDSRYSPVDSFFEGAGDPTDDDESGEDGRLCETVEAIAATDSCAGLLAYRLKLRTVTRSKYNSRRTQRIPRY